MSDLTGKVALITGAASGIGQAIAEHYAQAGAKIVIADIHQAAAEKTAQALHARGASVLSLTMDVTQESAVENAFAATLSHFGRIDILVSNAGIQSIAAVVDSTFENWRKMLAIHLDGAYLTTRAAMRAMQATGGGVIIYMGSVHSHDASVLKAPYVTAKHGLLGLAKTVAKEGAPHNIRSYVICPGFVQTPLVMQQIPAQAASLGLTEEAVIKNVMLKNTVDGEFTSLEDVAQMAVILGGWESRALTGQSFVVSHGWFMQ